MENDLAKSAISFFGVVVVLLVVVLVVSTLFAMFGPETHTNVGFEPSPGGTTLEGDELETVTVMDSTGYGLGLNYQGGSYSMPADSIGDNGTLVAWVALDVNASIHREYFIAEADNATLSLQYDDGDWRGCANTTAGRNCSTAVASNVTDLQLVGVRTDNSTVDLLLNDTAVNSSVLTAGGLEPVASDPLFGRMDELQLYTAPLNSSELTDLADDPFATPAPEDATARSPFDEGSGEHTFVVFQDTTAPLGNHTYWAEGLEGQELAAGMDYTLREYPVQVVTVDGGRLDELQYAWITYDEPGLLPEVTTFTVVGISLFGVGLIVVAGLAIARVATSAATPSGGRFNP